MAKSSNGHGWNVYRKDLDAALALDDPAVFRSLVKSITDVPHVYEKKGMLVDGNMHGKAYNAMGQATLGYDLLLAGQKFDDVSLIRMGIAALKVNLTNYAKGGLRLKDDGTAWYCGQTSRSQEDKGGTFNKHLHATITFFKAADVMEELGRDKWAKKYQKAGEQGLTKLVKGDDLPMLKDFFVVKKNGDVNLKAWVYYGVQNANENRGYYIANEKKNASYHLLDMKFIHEAAGYVSDSFNWKPFFKPALGGGVTSLGGMLDVYENKLAAGGLYQSTETKHGTFSAVLPNDHLSSAVVDWFSQF